MYRYDIRKEIGEAMWIGFSLSEKMAKLLETVEGKNIEEKIDSLLSFYLTRKMEESPEKEKGRWREMLRSFEDLPKGKLEE